MQEKYTFGLIDWELLMKASAAVFNLDLMQTSTYLKQKGKFVQLITHLDPLLLERYGKVYIFKDIDDNFYPREFFCAPNVEVIGRASGIGVETISPEVRRATPDRYIYLTAKRYFNFKELDTIKFKKMSEAVHVRLLDADGTVSKDWPAVFQGLDTKQWAGVAKQHVLIHDHYLPFTEDAYSDILELLMYGRNASSSPHQLWFKYPLPCRSDEEFLQWRNIPKSTLLTRYTLNHIPSMRTLIESLQIKLNPLYRTQFSRRGGENSIIYIHIQPDFSQEEFLERLYDLMLFSLLGRGCHTQIQVILPSPTYLDKEWYHFVQVLNDFWLYADEISLSAQARRVLSFNEYFLRNYEAGKTGIILIDDRVEAEGVRHCRRLLYNQNNDFFRLLNVKGHLEYDSEKRQVVKGGRK